MAAKSAYVIVCGSESQMGEYSLHAVCSSKRKARGLLEELVRAGGQWVDEHSKESVGFSRAGVYYIKTCPLDRSPKWVLDNQTHVVEPHKE